jgi:hypothetical protein
MSASLPDPGSVLKKFNWGAFLLPVFFGLDVDMWWFASLAFICNLTLILVPISMIVGGIYGRKWAWESSNFSNEEAFKYDTNSWIMTGLILNFIGLLILDWLRGLPQVAEGCLIMGGTFAGIALFMGMFLHREAVSVVRRARPCRLV